MQAAVRRRPSYDPAKARARLLKRYGLTPPDYARLLLAQGGGCAMCQRKPTGRLLDIDHDHLTREIRGLLCHRCNRALGYLSGEAVLNVEPYLSGKYTGYFVPKKKRRR
jgi:hypothetical protein